MTKRAREYITRRRRFPVLPHPQPHVDPDKPHRPSVTSVVVMSPEPGKWVVVHKAKVTKFTNEPAAREFARTLL